MSIHKKPSKWKPGHFPNERILAIANSGGFLANRHDRKDTAKNKRAYKLHQKGYLTFGQYDSAHREYYITELGKEELKRLRNQ